MRRESDRPSGASANRDVSIHDVMPETLDSVERTLAFLSERGATDVTLLVVPGREWSARDLDRLRVWVDAGLGLAGHGWVHHVQRFGGLYHRLHGLLLSRRVAEHLALDEEGIVRLLRENHAWFGKNGLPEPTLYVPPAWALGSSRRDRLRELPFHRYEVLGGMIDAATGRVEKMPLVGYEADAAWRVPLLRGFNAWNRRRAARTGATLRVSIHPHDIDLAMREDLARDVVSSFNRRPAPCGALRGAGR